MAEAMPKSPVNVHHTITFEPQEGQPPRDPCGAVSRETACESVKAEWPDVSINDEGECRVGEKLVATITETKPA